MKRTNLTPRIVLCLVFIIALVFAMASCDLLGIGGGIGHKHTYSSVVTEPTCTAQGFTTYICECGDSYVDNYVQGGHNLVNYEAKAATCSEEGHNAYEACTKCDYTTKKSIPTTGHNFVTKVTKFPTTSENGIETVTCTGCDYLSTNELSAVTVSLPSVAEAIRSLIGAHAVEISTEDAELIIIRELHYEEQPSYEKNFLALELAKIELSGEKEELYAYVELDLGVATYNTDKAGAAPSFSNQIVVKVIVHGDDVSVALTEGGDQQNSSFNISDMFYHAVAEALGLPYDKFVEYYYVAGQLTEYLPLAEAVVEWLGTIEIPEANTDLLDILAIISGELIVSETVGTNTVYTIDIKALGELLASVKDKTVAEIVDEQYGAGTMDKVEDFILSIPTSKIRDLASSAIEFSEAAGVPVESIYALINYFVYESTGVEFDIEYEIAERYEMTVIEVVIQLSTANNETPPTSAEIDEIAAEFNTGLESTIDMFKAFTVDQLLSIVMYGQPNYAPEGEVISVTDNLTSLLEAVDGIVCFELVVNSETGALVSLNASVDEVLSVVYKSNEEFILDLYVDGDNHINLTVNDGVYVTLSNGLEKILDGEISYVEDNGNYGYQFIIKAEEDEVFNASVMYLEDGTLKSAALDIYRVVYDTTYVCLEGYGDVSFDSTRKIYLVFDFDLYKTNDGYEITVVSNQVSFIYSTSDADSEGYYTDSRISELRHGYSQIITLIEKEDGFRVEMETVVEDETVQSATLDYTDNAEGSSLIIVFTADDDTLNVVAANGTTGAILDVTFNGDNIVHFEAVIDEVTGELLSADFEIHTLISGEIEGLVGTDHYLTVLDFSYVNNNGVVDMVIDANGIDGSWKEIYDEEGNLVEEIYVRTFEDLFDVIYYSGNTSGYFRIFNGEYVYVNAEFTKEEETNELLSLNLICNKLVEGELDGAESAEHLLPVFELSYTNDNGTVDLSVVINDAEERYHKQWIDEETCHEWITIEYENLLSLELSYNADALVLNVNGVAISLDLTKAEENLIGITVEQDGEKLADLVLGQTDEGTGLTLEGTIQGQDFDLIMCQYDGTNGKFGSHFEYQIGDMKYISSYIVTENGYSYANGIFYDGELDSGILLDVSVEDTENGTLFTVDVEFDNTTSEYERTEEIILDAVILITVR